jgi:cephalosporin hydroxylase
MRLFKRLLGSKRGGASSIVLTGEAGELLQQARSDFKHGEYLKGLRLVEKALAIHPDAAGLHHFKGLCLNRLARHDEALQEFQAELALNPGDPDATRWSNRLTKALAREEPRAVAWNERQWSTSLPRETLLRLQSSLHHYSYRGIPMLKDPFDVALYPLLLWRLKPQTLFEIGSKNGGSGRWLADMLTTFGIEGHVYSIDIVKPEGVSHPRLSFLEGDGRNLEATLNSAFLQDLPRPWLVVEDADHEYATSIAVLRFFDSHLRVGEYIVVEDGIGSDLAEDPECNSGPHRALKEFLRDRSNDYVIDSEYCDFFGHNVTWATNGYLRRTASAAGPMIDH